MNPLDIVHFLEELIRSEAKVIAFFVMGVGIAVVGVYCLRKWVFPAADTTKVRAELAVRELDIARKELKIHELDTKVEDRERKIAGLKDKMDAAHETRQRELAALQQRIAELSKACEELKEETVELGSAADSIRQQHEQRVKELDLFKRKAVTVVRGYKQQLAEINDQITRIEQQEGRVWESPVGANIPSFRANNGKCATIIALANLKGGVGKTTLTANIAATYGRMGKRVLAVDLDHQTSLTTLCLTVEQIKDLRLGAGKFVNNLLKASGNHESIACDNFAPIHQHGAFILAATKELGDVEEHVKAKWMLNPTSLDARYILRAALHQASIQDRFDIILLDCPPRPSTCLINALTCSDFLLIPAKPDRPSTDTVPYLLGWLQKLRAKSVCPDLQILGLVANEAFPRKTMISREKTVWSELADKCAQEWGEPVYALKRFVPKSSQFAEAAATRTFAADHSSLQSLFTDLVNEIEERRASHASASVATVS